MTADEPRPGNDTPTEAGPSVQAGRDARVAGAIAESHGWRPDRVEMVVGGGSVNHVFTVQSDRLDLVRWALDNRHDRLKDVVASSRAGIGRALLS